MNVKLFTVVLFLLLASFTLAAYIITNDVIYAVLCLVWYFAPLYIHVLIMIAKMEYEEYKVGENIEKR